MATSTIEAKTIGTLKAVDASGVAVIADITPSNSVTVYSGTAVLTATVKPYYDEACTKEVVTTSGVVTGKDLYYQAIIKSIGASPATITEITMDFGTAATSGYTAIEYKNGIDVVGDTATQITDNTFTIGSEEVPIVLTPGDGENPATNGSYLINIKGTAAYIAG